MRLDGVESSECISAVNLNNPVVSALTILSLCHAVVRLSKHILCSFV